MMHIHHQWQWQFSHQNGLFLPKKSNHFFHGLVGTVSNDLAVIKGATMPLTLTEKRTIILQSRFYQSLDGPGLLPEDCQSPDDIITSIALVITLT